MEESSFTFKGPLKLDSAFKILETGMPSIEKKRFDIKRESLMKIPPHY